MDSGGKTNGQEKLLRRTVHIRSSLVLDMKIFQQEVQIFQACMAK
jgi:hypothetical protein